MNESLNIALKEWAAVCRALSTGRQSLLIRKGGIAEPGFRVESKRFALFPTFVHQQETGLRAEARELLDEVKADRPTNGVAIDSWAEVAAGYQMDDLLAVHMIAHLHVWSDDAIEKRFHYRTPGVDVLALRVHRLAQPVLIDDDPDYAGCKSWVPLKREIALASSTPVLSDEHFHEVLRQLDALLRPTGLA